MLPLYTRLLSPADYGVIALLDLTVAVLGIIIRPGIAESVNRFHFVAKNEKERDEVWWSTLTLLLITATSIILMAWCIRDWIARITLTIPVAEGAFYYSLIFPTLWFNVISNLFELHLRVYKRSILFVLISLGKLCLNVGLNLFFLLYLDLGITGVLLGNLLTGIITGAVVFGIFLAMRGKYCINPKTLRSIIAFGLPLVVTTLLAFILHNADRYFLNAFTTMKEVGIYSLAYQVGQGVNMLLLIPFWAIWGVIKYEIENDENSREVYSTVFRHFTSVVIVMMLGVSLFARPLLGVLVDEKYWAAADVVPWICLGYIFFSASEFFTLAATLHKKTSKMIPPNVLAALANLSLNFLLIPWIGIVGAGISTVATFAVRSIVALLICNRIEHIPLPVLRQGVMLATAVSLYLFCKLLVVPLTSSLVGYSAALVCFLIVAVPCVAMPALTYAKQFLRRRVIHEGT